MVVLLMSLISLPLVAKAVVICPPSRSQITADRDLIHHVNQYDDDDRRLKADYARENKMTAAEVDKRYAGSGDLYCGGSVSQGQVTMKGNLILVAGHALGYRSNCEKPIKVASTCKFVVHIDQDRLTYEVEAEVAAGMKCPQNKDFALQADMDWAILKLKKSVDSRIKPYTASVLDPKDPATKLVAVGKSSDFHSAPKFDDQPRHYGNCDIKKIDEQLGEATRIQTNCDFDHGASGGGIFRPGPNPKVIGIIEHKSDGCKDGTGANGKGLFQDGCWTGIVTPINESIMVELQKAAGVGKTK